MQSDPLYSLYITIDSKNNNKIYCIHAQWALGWAVRWACRERWLAGWLQKKFYILMGGIPDPVVFAGPR